MTTSQPPITVLMTVYNGEPYLREASESILQQTYPHFRFLILDNASTDRSRDVIRDLNDPRIDLVELPENAGQVRALNQGLEMVDTPYMARMDADDVSIPTRLEEQLRIMERERDVVIVGSAYDRIDSQGSFINLRNYPCTHTEIRWRMLFHVSFCHSVVMVRTDALNRNGLRYDTDYALAEDYHLWSRLLRHGRGMNLAHPLMRFRVHQQQTARNAGDRQLQASERISRYNLADLGFSFSADEVRLLRDLYSRLPRPLSREGMDLCGQLLQVLQAFQKQPDVDARVVRAIRRDLIDRMLTATPIERIGDLLASGLLRKIVGTDIPSVGIHAAKRPLRPVRRLLRGYSASRPNDSLTHVRRES